MTVQLAHYLTILRRFRVLIVVLPLLVGIISLGAKLVQPPRYTSEARVILTQAPYPQKQVIPFPDVNIHYSWESSEFILDDLPQVVRSRAFAEDVSAWLAHTGHTSSVDEAGSAHSDRIDIDIDPSLIQNGLDAENFHRTVTFSSIASSPELAIAFLEGAIATLQSNGLAYWDRSLETESETGSGLSLAVLDPPVPAHPVRSTPSLLLEVGLRVGLALVAAVGLAFLLHYLDNTLRDPAQVEAGVGLRVIGIIPEE
jgi:capsular polysaccharide biosynthesis protein